MNSNPSRIGQTNGAGDVKALFLKLFAGEVLTAFYAANVFMPRHTVRTISSGKTAQFPASGKGVASYHTPGTELLGTALLHAERTISIDDMLIADRFISNIDEAMNHYDIRSIYSTDIGEALSATFDKNVAQVGCLAARATATVTGGSNGDVISTASMDTSATVLAAGIFSAVQKLQEKNVPLTNLSCFLRPAQYYLLVQDSKITNRDYATNNGGIDSGVVFRVAGVPIVMTNNLPSTNVTTGPTAYQGDFSKTYGLVMAPSAVGSVKLLDLAMESEYDLRRQGTLMIGKYAVGHGILRPESAVELVKP